MRHQNDLHPSYGKVPFSLNACVIDYKRLADFSANTDQDVSEINSNINIFEMFKTNIDNIIANKSEEIPINKLLELQVAFLKFSIYCYPNESNYVN